MEAFVSGEKEELHRAVQQGVAMADMLRAVLQKLYGQASHEEWACL
ncbi:MAG: hypothetical protein NZ482_09045 [Gloeomargarita sp. SKYG98]|nr:hypothetical protein [Gloeomargarita sp. SKYG98]